MYESRERQLIQQDIRSVAINYALWWMPTVIIYSLDKSGLLSTTVENGIMYGSGLSVLLALIRKYLIYHAYKK